MTKTIVQLATLALLTAPLAAQKPAHSSSAGASAPRQTAVFAGGCFWGIQNVFEHVRGVTQVTSGYAGGHTETADYETVSSGATGHAESVRVVFDPSVVSYETLLKVFFTVAHDPTQLNRQGPDVGTQYRSAVFFANESQRHTAQAVIDSLSRAKTWPGRIVTEVVPLGGFFVAEAYHQDYAIEHPLNPYIYINDRPKVIHLRDRWPDLFQSQPVRYAP